MSYWTGTHWVAEAPATAPRKRPSRSRHALEAITEGSLVAVLVVGLLAGTAFAGKGSGGTSSSVWVEELAAARGAALSYGSDFTVGYATKERQPWGHALCYPNDSTVYRFTRADGSVWGQYYSLYAGGPTPQAFELIDPIAKNWTGGGADCVVRLVKLSGDYSRETVLATYRFTVAP